MTDEELRLLVAVLPGVQKRISDLVDAARAVGERTASKDVQRMIAAEAWALVDALKIHS